MRILFLKARGRKLTTRWQPSPKKGACFHPILWEHPEKSDLRLHQVSREVEVIEWSVCHDEVCHDVFPCFSMFFHYTPSVFPHWSCPSARGRHSGTPDPPSLGPAQGLELPGFQFWPFLAISNCVKATQGVDGFFQGLLGLSLVVMKRMIIPATLIIIDINWY